MNLPAERGSREEAGPERSGLENLIPKERCIVRKRSGLSALLLVLMLVMAPLAAAAAGVSVTDSVGRTVTVPEPEQLQKVYVTSPVGFIFMYTLDFERLAGTPMKFNEQELKYLNPACADMPLLGGMQMGKQLNREAIVDAGTQLLISMGPGKPKDTDASQADELQEQLGIPVVVVDASMENIEGAYEFLGRLLGREERAARLAAYCRAVLDDVKKKISAVPEEKRVSVYYAEGPDGLTCFFLLKRKCAKLLSLRKIQISSPVMRKDAIV